MDSPPDMQAAAHWYAEHDIPVLPLHWPIPVGPSGYRCSCSNPACASPAKHPIGQLVPHGFEDASTDPGTITAWWTQYPRANIGLRTGTVFDALDIDGPAGHTAHQNLITQLGADIDAIAVVKTGRKDGGRQYYCQPAGHKNFTGGKNGIPQGIDCRGQGGYVVAVPSKHITGARYTWITRWGEANGVHGAPWDDAYQALTTTHVPDEPQAPVQAPGNPTQGVGTPYALKALQSECDTIRTTPEGARNDQLNTAAYNLGQLVAGGQLELFTTREALTEAARFAGLDEKEIQRTIQSGLSDGGNNPRTPALAPGPVNVPTAMASTETEATPTSDQTPVLTLDEQALQYEVRQLRIRRQARKILDDEDAANTFPWPAHLPTLADDLAQPDTEPPHIIEPIWPAGGNVLLAAEYKTGKTTLVNETARALADLVPFLGKFEISDHPGRIVIFNFEMGANLYRRWWRDAKCVNPERITLVHLRGTRLPLLAPLTQQWCINTLLDMECQTWIIDPFAQAFAGAGDENSNADVNVALNILDYIKEQADVANLLLATHTGRAFMAEGAERARGATRLDDWADVRWILTKDEKQCRYLRATGRDVEVEEQKLSYDEETRHLTFGGGDRSWERRRRLEQDILNYIAANPGCTAGEIRTVVNGKADAIVAARQSLLGRHEIVIKDDSRNGRLHYIHDPSGGVDDHDQ